MIFPYYNTSNVVPENKPMTSPEAAMSWLYTGLPTGGENVYGGAGAGVEYRTCTKSIWRTSFHKTHHICRCGIIM